MKKSHLRSCEVCNKKFDLVELYPITLVRHTVLNAAKKSHPDLNIEGFVCYPDLRKISTLHFEEILSQEKGVLSDLEKEVLHSLKEHEVITEDINKEIQESLTFGQRLADKIARFGGSWAFISLFGFVLITWMVINTIHLFEQPFDPYPYILLNLVLSCLAAVQAPIILMSQNRQASRDRISFENDYQTNLKAELQTRQINAKLELLMKHHWQNMHELKCFQEEILQEFEVKKRKK
ncbi:MAG: DUF1003 domain-containing protein [Waddliaceae bacterium]